MERDLIEQLAAAVQTFNARADRAAARGLRVAAEALPRQRRIFHLSILRTVPLGADLQPERQDEECTAEVALLSAAAEVNRLVDEARRQQATFELRLVTDATTHERSVELVSAIPTAKRTVHEIRS